MEQTIKLSDREVTVQKLRLRKLAELFGVLDSLPKILSDLSDSTEQDMMVVLPKIIAQALPEIIAGLAIATPLTEDELDELEIADLAALIKTVFEVNNFKKVGESLKAILPASPTSTPEAGSSK